MRPSCPGGRRPASGGGRQQFQLWVEAGADPVLELTVARILLIALDELHAEGIVVHQVHLDLAGGNGGRSPARPEPGRGQPS